MIFKTVLVDDEQPARARLSRMLEKYEDVEVVGEATNGQEALAAVEEKEPDLLFLDIQMPPPTGLEVAADLLEVEDPPIIIFLTAYQEHAVEAFELSALDYLVKPVRRERLTKTLERVRMASRDRRDGKLSNDTEGENFDPMALQYTHKEARKLVPLEEIEYFTTRDEVSYAIVNGTEFIAQGTLTKLQELLPNSLFLRSHRSYIVNLKQVQEIEPWFHRSFNLHLKGGAQVPLSRSYAPAFRRRVNWS